MRIKEDEDSGAVLIDGYRVEGWLDDDLCPRCQHQQVYSIRYDAYFCPACNTWLESACGDRGCEFCKARPAKPLPERASA